jgi:hypothetical protein
MNITKNENNVKQLREAKFVASQRAGARKKLQQALGRCVMGVPA